MDYNTVPVARRTRARQDKLVREIFEKHKKTKIEKENRNKNNGNATEEEEDEEEEEEEEERDSDFVTIPSVGSGRNDVVGDAREETAKRRRFDGNGETSGTGSGTTRGTMENPVYIDDDDDDDDDDVELSSESSEGNSDETYEVDDDDEADQREREESEDGEIEEEEEEEERERKEEKGRRVSSVKEKIVTDSDDDDDFLVGNGYNQKEEKKKKKRRERREEKMPRVSSEKEKSHSDSDDDPSVVKISDEKEEKKKERERRASERKEKSDSDSDDAGLCKSSGPSEEKEKTPMEAYSDAMEISSGDESSPESGARESVANAARRRTRLQSKRMAGLGTLSSPFSFSEEETSQGTSEDSSEDEMDEDERPRRPSNRNLKGDNARPLGKGKGSKRAAKGNKDLNFIQILLDSMDDKTGKGCLEELVSDERDVDLPLKFSFKEIVIEELDYEKELDGLWSDFHISLASEEIGSSASNQVECEGEVDEDTLCELGKHRTHILDEEIGIICKNCSAVILEIQYVLPSFDQNPAGRPDFRGLGKGNNMSFFDKFDHGDEDSEALSDSELRARAKTVWDVIPGVKEDLYKHQREGFEFIWKHIAGGIERENFEHMESFTNGRGCIISHAPGTGKSRLTIVFLQSLIKLHPRILPVIIAPCSMLLTWEEEFKKWKVNVPFHNLNAPGLSGNEDNLALRALHGAGRKDGSTIRMVKLYSWRKGGSVLGLSYQTFEKMAGAQKDALGQRVRRFLLDLPDLLVLDEGHIPRNDNSLIWKALTHVRTQRRIILSGTPFQNNFDELFNTMRVVNPKFSETSMPATLNKKHEIQKKARRDWNSLTKSLGKDADSKTEAARLKRIKSFIDPLVHIHRGDVLEEKLKGIRESVVFLKPSETQKKLLKNIKATQKEQLQHERAVSLISVHPSLSLNLSSQIAPSHNATELKTLRSDPESGVKSKFLVELIRLCVAANERVLIFSQFLDPLSLIIEHLKSRFAWDECEILYIDGKREMKERQASINAFNNPKSAAKVLLVSTKAGGEGINLVGASRVVLLDTVWNPSVEKQATRRAYRIGQEKFVYVYHLIASGTMEETKYSRQASKDRMSKLVFSSAPGCAANGEAKRACEVKEDRVLDEMVSHGRLKDIFEKILVKNKDSTCVEDQVSMAICTDF